MCILLALLAGQTGHALTQAPDWFVKTVDGRDLSLHQELKSGKKVVLVFWAGWCSYCKAMMPKIQMLADSTDPKQATFVSMNIWQEGSRGGPTPQEFFEQWSVSLPLVLHADGIARQYKINATPGVFVIGNDYQVLYEYVPKTPIEKVMGQIQEILRNPTQESVERSAAIQTVATPPLTH